MKKIVYIFTLIVFSGLSLSVKAVNKSSPEEYFSGQYLLIAKAIVNGSSDELIALTFNTELNLYGKEDMTLLFFAINHAISLDENKLSAVSVLTKAGADPLQDVPDMGSVAEIVATSPHPEFMRALIDGGMDVNAKVQGQPLLHDAASDDTLKTLALMVNRGADVNATDSLGKSTVMAALDGMQLDTVEWLLNHGANPNSVEKNTGWSFMRQLDDVIKRNNGDNGATHDKLMMILNLARQKGGRT